MDPSIGWYQPEQQGQAKELWVRMWLTQQGMSNMNENNNNNNNENIDNSDYIPINNSESNRTSKSDSPSNNNSAFNGNYYNPTKRKRENRASTYGLNENSNELIGIFGGCPWRSFHPSYALGTAG